MQNTDARTRTLLLRLPAVTAERAVPPPPLELLGESCDKLEALADALEQVRDALDSFADDAVVRRRVDRSRKARAMLHKVQSAARSVSLPPTPAGLALMKRLKAATERTRPGELALQQWLARPLPPLEDALGLPDGPARIVDNLMTPAFNLDYDVAVLFGTDTSELARDLAARGCRRIVAYLRPDESQERFPPRTFVVRSHEELQGTVAELNDPFPLRVVGKHLLSWPVTVDEAEDLKLTITDALERTLAQQTTMKHFGPLWSSQALANLPRVAGGLSVASLRGPLEGKPIVLVAPGPSLAQNVHLLRDLKGKAVILAYSRALRSLAEAGVSPDLVVVLDPLDLRYHFDDFPLEQVEALVLGLSVNPGLYDLPAKRVITFSGNSTIENWIYSALDEDMAVRTSCSVATSAVTMARLWGCDPIIMVGQDLAFPGGKLYDAAASDGDATLEKAEDGRGYKVLGLGEQAQEMDRAGEAKLSGFQRLAEVPGYYGGTVQTSPNFSWVRAWIEEKAVGWQGTVRMFNCTEGGANIEGMENVPLSEALEICADQTVDVGAILDQLDAATDWKARKRTILTLIDDVQKALNRSNQLARQCLKLIKGGNPTEKALRKLTRAENELNGVLQPARVVISLYGQVEILDAMDRARDAKTMQENLKASRELYDVVRYAHEQGYPALEKAGRVIRGG